ncbi:AB hydrolase superfamily protein C4A8.06c [Cyphellophora attinorum]|uniref:AB hydrolase superfamily protein C4A8.06c n=1 Tax=Cyphellophora attinorum TaxID=1664694 RepID=A0A0N1HI91_9EURO|nr:AB hydrolase superfamily protein C4A8.06c [Phialophora attinorum]KPI45982.1 AB hydrolase superfamily protein C4A8.06c [Phialophora attinorum]
MTITTFQVASAVTPTVVKTCVSHYANRKPRAKKPTAHISYDEGLHLIKTFLTYASTKTIDELQAFTAQWVPTPTWVKTDNVDIPPEQVSRAADAIIKQLGPEGVKAVGGVEWWQWRRNDSVLRAEWIEMSSHYLERKREKKKGRRIMLYVHGGGYFFGSVDEHRYQMQRHARKLKARVLAPRYRLAPQFPFPCGLQDCLAVYLYLLTVHSPSEIVLAGDSAGGGMVVSMLCILRDQGLPLPAGAVLISPWVDLTHSFPSVSGDNPLDYIPSHGFHHRPSVAWPPPNDDEGKALERLTRTQSREEAFAEKTDESAERLGVAAPGKNDPGSSTANRVPAPNHFLSIHLNNKLVLIQEQIQLYTTNALLSHPLVSPILQPSLGGLPPLCILVGGGEMLRDEQIYLAHKAANPHRYPLSDTYRSRYDPEDKILNQYKATPVQLQVWEDLCHVAPTLSFTRPAKYMYRSIAQFGAWALARAQERPIEIMDDDNISIISTESDSESPTESTDSIAQMKNAAQPQPKFVGRAGDPLPFFHNHMIRQLVNRYGNISDLPSADELPATTMDINEVGLIKPGPVQKWMDAKDSWASKYASTKKKVQKQRIEMIHAKKNVPFGPDEKPPPSALATRRTAREVEKKQRKSYGLAMWSMWGSKHDEMTIKREKDMDEKEDKEDAAQSQEPEKEQLQVDGAAHSTATEAAPEGLRPQTSPRARRTGQANANFIPTQSHQPTLPSMPSSVSQLENDNVVVTPPATADASNPVDQAQRPNLTTATSGMESFMTAPESNTPLPTPLFLPKFRTASHLRSPSQTQDVDTMSTRTGYSAMSVSGASTRAVFSAPGISKVASATDGPTGPQQLTAADNNAAQSSNLSSEIVNGFHPTTRTASSASQNRALDSSQTTPTAPTFPPDSLRPTLSSRNGNDTPTSRLSIERLRTHNAEYEAEVREEQLRHRLLEGDERHAAQRVVDDGAVSTLNLDGAGAQDNGVGLGDQEKEASGALGLPPLQTLRSPSSVAVVGAEGVVGVVGGEKKAK